MPAPHVSESFADLLDPRFREIAHEQYAQLPDMLSELFTMPSDNGRADERWSSVGALDNFGQFTGTVNYDSFNQGFDTIATHIEFASGIQVERKLFDDDQYGIIEQRPRALATAAARTRQVHGARLLNNAFSNDQFFYVDSEGVALCSDSHTTNSGASTAAGFDNLTTAALSATAMSAARIQMVNYRDDRANRISITPDELWIPPDLFEQAFEIVSALGKVDTADNNPNVHRGAYTVKEWNYLTDTNNWFLSDSTLRKQSAFWVDRVPIEFAMAEDIDTLIAKFRGYMRYLNAKIDWRWILGANVS